MAIAGYFSHLFLVLFGYFREFVFGPGPLNGKPYGEGAVRDGYAPLLASFESFYTRCVYRRVRDTFFRPMSSVPGAKITLVNRVSDDHFWTLKMDETRKKECINLASYNYLGFAENTVSTLAFHNLKVIKLKIKNSQSFKIELCVIK